MVGAGTNRGPRSRGVRTAPWLRRLSRPPVAALIAVLCALAVVVALAVGGGAARPLAGRSGKPGGDADRAAASSHKASERLSTAAAGGVPLDRAAFAAGACVEFAPTARDNHRTVFIDAGHGGIDPGGQGVTETGKVIYEAGENLTIELEVANLLRSDGFRVVVSRVTDTDVMKATAVDLTNGALSSTGAVADVAARDACANAAGATILVGIYLDAGTSPLDAGSITAYDPDRPFAAESKRLATLLQRDVLAGLNAHGWQIPDDGVQPDTTLGGLPLTTTATTYDHLLLLGPADPGWFTTPSRMPGALIEPLFISDPFEGSIADSTTGRATIARGMAQAIEQYFGRSATG